MWWESDIRASEVTASVTVLHIVGKTGIILGIYLRKDFLFSHPVFTIWAGVVGNHFPFLFLYWGPPVFFKGWDPCQAISVVKFLICFPLPLLPSLKLYLLFVHYCIHVQSSFSPQPLNVWPVVSLISILHVYTHRYYFNEEEGRNFLLYILRNMSVICLWPTLKKI